MQILLEVKEDWQTLIEDLARRVTARRLTQQEIAKATGVDQSQVSRILAGEAKRPSRNVARLCSYAKGLQAPSTGKSGRAQIDRAIDQLWDGSPRHASAIAGVLVSIAHAQTVFAGNRKKR